MRRWAKRVMAGLVALLVVALVVRGFLPEPVAVEVGAVRRAPFRQTVSEEGRTRVRDRFVLYAPLTGYMSRILLQPGDVVSPGQVVTYLQPPPSPLLDPRSRDQAVANLHAAEDARRQASDQVDRAASALNLARQEAGRQARLRRGHANAKSELDRAAADAQMRRSELRAAMRAADQAASREMGARAALDAGAVSVEQRAVVSPVAGRVLRVDRVSEGPVAAGAALIEIGDPSALEMVVDVLTPSAVEIRPGMPASLTRWGGGVPFPGRVRTIEPSAFTRVSALGVEEQRVNVIVDPVGPGAVWSALGDGFSVQAEIVTYANPRLLQVPASALFRQGAGWAAWVIEAGRAQARQVEVGRRNASAAEVLRGLAEGDLVIVHPPDAVKAGVKVEAAPAPPGS